MHYSLLETVKRKQQNTGNGLSLVENELFECTIIPNNSHNISLTASIHLELMGATRHTVQPSVDTG